MEREGLPAGAGLEGDPGCAEELPLRRKRRLGARTDADVAKWWLEVCMALQFLEEEGTLSSESGAFWAHSG